MSIRDEIQEAIKQATKDRNHARLDTLRMAKGALLLKEKEKARDTGISDEEAVVALRAEVSKRRQSLEIYRDVNKPEEADKLAVEISVLEEFLPQQLSEAAVEEKVRAFLSEHPDMTHAGKLTGALKKELGDQVDGKVLNDVCRRVLG